MPVDDLCVFERDLWLARALAAMRVHVQQRGLVLPSRISIRAGETPMRSNGRVLGQCFPQSRSLIGVPLVLISEELTNVTDILGTIVHELIHAADDCKDGHGPWFMRWARALDLEGGPGTIPSVTLLRQLHPTVRWLGPYPRMGTGYILSSEGLLVG